MLMFQDNRELVGRLKWIRILFAVIFVCLCAKLWSLTVVHYEHYRDLAERNRIHTFPQIAPRGLIYDREGRVLVDNVYSFNLLLFRDEVQDLEETLQFLVEGLKVAREDLEARLRAVSSYPVFRPIVVKENLSIEDVAFLLAHRVEYPELEVIKQPRRLYRYGNLGAHVLGYVGKISPGQLEESEFKPNRPGDTVGQYGVERRYNRNLIGRDGQRRVLVDSRGRSVQEIELTNPILGGGVTLTLDLDLQLEAEVQLGDDPGAIIVFDARNGEILVMASRPTFDPNQFARTISRREWKRLIENPDAPLQNRVIQNAFSPGSVFKVVMAMAGLQRGIIDERNSVDCMGGVTLYNHWFHCWKVGGHGQVSLREALRQSCNVYFYLLAQKLGIQEIAEFSRRFGLGVPTGIDLLGEVSGLVPSERWKEEVRGEPWYAGETISVAIGQGPLLTTPAQLARTVGIIATGTVVPLHLLKDGARQLPGRTEALSVAELSPRNLQLIRDAMWSSVNEWGTGHNAQVDGFQVCGKTGTAQTISTAGRQHLSEEATERFEPNAWFVGFAPLDHPEIVIAVVVQRGGTGGAAAAPIAGEILRLYYQKYKVKPAGQELAWAKGREKTL